MGQQIVLIIDDDPVVHALIKEMLGSSRYIFHETFDGKDGIKLFSQIIPDLVILDIMMPGESGIGVIEKLCNKISQVKIIAISSGIDNGKSDLLRMAKILGAGSTMKKPLLKEDLIRAVENALAN